MFDHEHNIFRDNMQSVKDECNETNVIIITMLFRLFYNVIPEARKHVHTVLGNTLAHYSTC